nr:MULTISPECIES: IS110 family transposase [Streptomyces]
MFVIEDVGMFLGLDVGKTAHHGHGLTPAGKKVFDKPLPNSEPRLRAVFDKLRDKFGTVLVVVDQPASIGALPLLTSAPQGEVGVSRVRLVPAMKPSRVSGRYCRRLSRFRTRASSRSRAMTARLCLTWAQTHSSGLRSGA